MARIDVALVERGLFASRAKAREAIEERLQAASGDMQSLAINNGTSGLQSVFCC